jgi:hypothetical protein
VSPVTARRGSPPCRSGRREQDIAQITGLHSVTVENDTVFCGFDIVPDPTGDGILFFEFELPALVSRDDLRAFGEWLASSGYGGTLH